MKINDNVLAACHKYGVKKVVSVRCSCIFPDKTTYPIEEKMVQTWFSPGIINPILSPIKPPGEGIEFIHFNLTNPMVSNLANVFYRGLKLAF